MATMRRIWLLAIAAALTTPAVSFARDRLSTGEPTETLATLELDRTFGHRGEVRSAARGGIRFESFARAAIDSDGRIVVAGSAIARPAGKSVPCVARFGTDGRLDRSFAGGIVALPLRGEVGGVAIDSTGRIVVCGKFRGAPGSARAGLEFVAVRIRANGRIDTHFAEGGLAPAPDFAIGQVSAARLDPRDDAILQLITVARGGSSAWGVIRLTPDGDADPLFGGEGFAEVGENAESLAIDSRGRIVAGGAPVRRLLGNGFLDRSLGTDGELLDSIGERADGAVAIDGQGRIVVAGLTVGGRPPIFRFLTDGSPDVSLSGDGRIAVPIATRKHLDALDLKFAAASGSADRYVFAAEAHFHEQVDETPFEYDVGTGCLVQAIDPKNPGALSAYVQPLPRHRRRLEPAVTDLVVADDGATAYAVGFRSAASRGRGRTTPFLLRVDLTPKGDVPLPDFQISWNSDPTLTPHGPIATGLVAVESDADSFSLRIHNSGAAGGAQLRIWLSADDVVDAGDLVLADGGTDRLETGATMTWKSFGGSVVVFTDPTFTGLSGMRVIAQINPDGWSPESDTTNNTAVSKAIE